MGISRRRIVVLAACLALDLWVVWVSHILTIRLSGAVGTSSATTALNLLPFAERPATPEAAYTFVMTPFLITLLYLNGFYETRRGTRYSQEFFGVFRTVCLAVLFAITVNFLFLRLDISRYYAMVHSLMVFVGQFTWRYLKRKYVEHRISRGYRRTPSLIVGAGHIGRYLGMILTSKKWLGTDVVGYLDDRFGLEEEDSGNLIGRIGDFEQVVRDQGIREVYITIPSERKITARLIEISSALGVTVKVVPDMFDLLAREVKFENVGSLPVMKLRVPALLQRQLLVKRVLELFLAIIAICLLSPLMGLIALAVKIESDGPILFRQVVLGRSGRPVTIFKFRSMVKDADIAMHREYIEKLVISNAPADEEERLFKLTKDERVTRLGGFLRKYSLDELPQLWNVVRGDLSLVGPRPPLSYEYGHYTDLHKKRLLVKPGVTGLWQVSGKSRLSFEEMIRLDFMYINEWSIWLDLKIILDTIPVVLRGENA
jgi:exopolysaccharide biosynthesis polyprenyl glycosylphosphotransferase